MDKEETVSTQPAPQDIFSLLRSYSKELYALDSKPLLDRSFSFPWNECGTALSKTFGIEISLSPKELKWRDEKDLYDGIVSPFIPLHLAVPGVTGQFFLVISRSDIELVMKESLQVSTEQLLGENKTFFDEFLIFFKAEICCVALALESLKSISPRLAADPQQTEAGYLCLDIAMTIAGEHSLSRLFLPAEFLTHWKKFRSSSERDDHLIKNITLQVSVEAGRTFVVAKDLSSFQVGDVLLLQHPFFIPESEKSRVFLTYRGKPLFRAKLKAGGIKILEMPLQHEAFIPLGEFSMANKEPVQEELEEQYEEHTIEGITEGVTEEPHPEKIDEEEDPFKEEETPPLPEESIKEASKKSTILTDKPLRLQDIPLSVVAQLTELTMTMGELGALQPGNLLDLDIRPEDGVSLVINGRIVAHGELILIGDHVGVRLQEINLQQ